jgi:hypothetical protein
LRSRSPRSLAIVAVRQLTESRNERRATEASLHIAEETFRAQLRPELIACPETNTTTRRVHVATYGQLEKELGGVEVGVQMMDAQVGLVSFDVSNTGAGAAEIRRVRVMSLDTLAHGGGPEYWEPHPLDFGAIVVPADGTAPVDLVMAPQPPGWFYRHVNESRLRFWVEVTYTDLGGVETHVRWFEFWQRSYQPYTWFIGQVRRSEPQHFSNLPPANPLADYVVADEAELGVPPDGLM